MSKKDADFAKAFQFRIRLVSYDELGYDEDLLYKLIKEGSVKSYSDSYPLKPLQCDHNVEIRGAAYVTEIMAYYMDEFNFLRYVEEQEYSAVLKWDPSSPHSNVRVFRWKGMSREVYDVLKKLSLHLKSRSAVYFENLTVLPESLGHMFPNFYEAVDNLVLEMQPIRCGKILPIYRVPTGVVSYYVCIAEGHEPDNCTATVPSTRPYSTSTLQQQHTSPASRPSTSTAYEQQWATAVEDLTQLKKRNAELRMKNVELHNKIGEQQKQIIATRTALLKAGDDPKIKKYVTKAAKKADGFTTTINKLVKQTHRNFANVLTSSISVDMLSPQDTPVPQEASTSASVMPSPTADTPAPRSQGNGITRTSASTNASKKHVSSTLHEAVTESVKEPPRKNIASPASAKQDEPVIASVQEPSRKQRNAMSTGGKNRGIKSSARRISSDKTGTETDSKGVDNTPMIKQEMPDAVSEEQEYELESEDEDDDADDSTTLLDVTRRKPPSTPGKPGFSGSRKRSVAQIYTSDSSSDSSDTSDSSHGSESADTVKLTPKLPIAKSAANPVQSNTRNESLPSSGNEPPAVHLKKGNKGSKGTPKTNKESTYPDPTLYKYKEKKGRNPTDEEDNP